MLSLMSVRDGGRLRSALQHLDMTPPEPGFAATATRFRRSYMLAAALPLLTFVALVLIGVTWERGVLSERFAAANREQADTAERAQDMDGAQAEEAKQRAKEALEGKNADMDYSRAAITLAEASARLRTIEQIKKMAKR